ncbi:MAG: hypothetical protein K8R59_01655 [Thermoanaerobaculales bacterium]|nr:hypothetical protein [Thermoanaerobaculales bacterium]
MKISTNLTERDICIPFISPAIESAGRNLMSQVREEVSFTAGRIIVRGKLVTRGKAKLCEFCDTWHPKTTGPNQGRTLSEGMIA